MGEIKDPISQSLVDRMNALATATLKAADSLSKMVVEGNKLIDANNKLTTSDDTLATKKKQLTEIEKEAERIRKAQLSTNAKLEKSRSDEARSLVKTRLELQKTSKEIRLDIQLKKAQKGSIEQLTLVNATLEQRLKKVNLATEDGRKKAQTFQNVINKNTQKIKENSSVRGKQILSIGGYNEGIKGAISETGIFATQQRQLAIIQKLITALTFKQAEAQAASTAATTLGSKAMNIFKIALASTGIGLLVIALGSLVAFFKSSEEGAAALARVMSPLKILFGNLKDVAIGLGEGIFNAFSNPKQAIIDLWELIKTNIVNRFVGVIDLFKGLGTVIKGALELDVNKIKEGAKQAGNAFIQTMTGVEDAVGKASGAIGRLIDETAKENDQNKQLADARLALIKRERSAALEIAKLNVDIANDRIKIKDEENLNDEERLAFTEKAIEGIRRKGEIEKELATERLRQQVLENSFSTSSQEDLDKESELRVALLNTESAAAKESLRIESEKQALLKRIKADGAKFESEIDADLLLESKENDDAELKQIEDFNKKEQKAVEDNAKKITEAKKKANDEQIALNELLRDKTIDLAVQGVEAVTGILFEASAQQRDEELERLSEQRDEDIERVETEQEEDLQSVQDKLDLGLINEDQAAAQRTAINTAAAAEKKKIDDDLAKKEAEIKTKQAKADKAAALIGVAINTALGISSALSKVATIPLIPFIAAAGAIEAATILATPIPKFERGTDGKFNTPNRFIAGEAGREALIDRSGRVTLTPDKATLYSNMPNHQVIPHAETQKMLNGLGSGGVDGFRDDRILNGLGKIEKAVSRSSRSRTIDDKKTTKRGNRIQNIHRSFIDKMQS